MSQQINSPASDADHNTPSTTETARIAPDDSSHRSLALVLGGGGAGGNAWEIGLIAGLTDAGFDVAEAADGVIGTSAGATAAAQVRSGTSPAD